VKQICRIAAISFRPSHRPDNLGLTGRPDLPTAVYVVIIPSCPRLWLQALNISGVEHVCSPSSASVLVGGEGRLAQAPLRAVVDLLGKMVLEPDRLLDAEGLEVAVSKRASAAAPPSRVSSE
jgi:hypothetical protein